MIEREGVGGAWEKGSVKCDVIDGTLASPLKSSKQFYCHNNEHICPVSTRTETWSDMFFLK